jgi:hypothetical protein
MNRDMRHKKLLVDMNPSYIIEVFKILLYFLLIVITLNQDFLAVKPVQYR